MSLLKSLMMIFALHADGTSPAGHHVGWANVVIGRDLVARAADEASPEAPPRLRELTADVVKQVQTSPQAAKDLLAALDAGVTFGVARLPVSSLGGRLVQMIAVFGVAFTRRWLERVVTRGARANPEERVAGRVN